MQRTYVALFDVAKDHTIEAVVIYESRDGTVIRIVGTWEAGPFTTSYEGCQWLTRTITLDSKLLES